MKSIHLSITAVDRMEDNQEYYSLCGIKLCKDQDHDPVTSFTPPCGPGCSWILFMPDHHGLEDIPSHWCKECSKHGIVQFSLFNKVVRI